MARYDYDILYRLLDHGGHAHKYLSPTSSCKRSRVHSRLHVSRNILLVLQRHPSVRVTQHRAIAGVSSSLTLVRFSFPFVKNKWEWRRVNERPNSRLQRVK
jgi:hypothetical protein